MHLQKASADVPPGLSELLRELGDGEAGFGGTAVGNGTQTLDAFLCACRDGEDAAKVAPGFVPQTVFWMTDDGGRVVGMVRMRHALNDRLRQHGGHLGYYVRLSERRKGYATAALRLAVDQLRAIGVDRALITVRPTNVGSIKSVLANGGKPDGQGRDPDSGEAVNRYWIDLSPAAGALLTEPRTLSITQERADSEAAVALIAELDAHLSQHYPAESRHGFSVEKLLRDGVVFFVIRQNDVPAGCGGLLFVGSEVAELKRMYVRPIFRGRGFGRQMLEHLERFAHDRQIRHLRLETGIYQTEAIALYEHAGFERIKPFAPYREDPLSRCYEKRIAGEAIAQ
jgi:putative acetyltransferase